MKAAETDWQQPSANWSDHLFVTLARMTTQMAVVTDAQRKIVWINNAFTEITGYTLAEAIGANPGQLLQGEMTDPEAVERMRAAMDATKPKPFTEEVLNYTKSGRSYWVEVRVEPIFSEKGELCGYFSLNENVTGRKEELHRSRYRQQQLESERALLEQERIISQKTLKSVIRCAPSAIVITNTEHVITSFNPAAETLLGYSAEEIIGKETPALFHDMDEVIGKARKLGWDGDENAVVFDELVPYFQRGISNLEEWFYISKSGERIPVLLGLISFSDDDGEVIGFMGFVTDLRDQISAETQRKQMLTRLEKITRQLPGFIYEYLQNPDGSSTFPYASSGIERIYGVTPAQAAQDASLVWKAIYPEDIPRVKESISASMQIANEWNCDYRIMGKEGSLRWASGSANPERLADGSVVWHGYIADSTERLDAELALAQKTSLLKLLTETALNFINVPIDQADRAIENSLRKIGKFFNVDRVYVFKYDSNLGISINTHEWCSDGIEPFIDQLQNVPIEWDSEWYFKHAKGEELQISDVSAMPSCSVKEILSMQGIQSILSVPMMHDGESIGFVGFDAVETQRHFHTDEIKLLQVFSRALVSVRSRIDDHHALKDSQAQLESFFEVALDLFCICDSEGRFLRVSHAWEIFLGLSNEQIVGRYFIDFVHPEDRSATQIAMQDLAGGQKIDEFVNRYLNKDGQWRNLSWVSILSNGRVFASSRDVTAEIEASTALTQSLLDAQQIADTRSRLISMASHEFRTPLASIRLSTEMLLAQLQKQVPGFEQLTKRQFTRILGSTDHLTNIIADVLDIEGINDRKTGAFIDLDASQFCQDCLNVFEETHKPPQQLAISIHSDCCHVFVNESWLRSTLNNLLQNAVNYSPAESCIEVAVLSDKTSVFIEVKDNGRGIPSNEVDKIFDPFFRAKNVSEVGGTGLGLPIVWRNMERMFGSVCYQSNEPSGSIFRLSLPKVAIKLPEK